ncbi:hypothetical protein QO010_004371 [Caulobacter ginsengisoli]|uniref:DUF1579 domain-containing protein n=1 Tax=Caulobacter ginsengisoli TaxID=400775 RepID=A0ABU0IZ55_9CAUL|nr:DUF1579 domain-containing protein [Caulobacter ginsengisoli]MDQ0466576.1 hypothetical protein [Caulobacter ginsengisoli]
MLPLLETLPPGADAFDFFPGHWTVRHRRLDRRLAGCQDWTEFPGRTVVERILGGLGNIDDNTLDIPGRPYRAATVRKFDTASGLWSIWWYDARYPGLEPPVHGRFENGVGTFLGDDVFEGRPIKVRFIWSGITAKTARWEQAFSEDGGESWETNWIMDFERTA